MANTGWNRPQSGKPSAAVKKPARMKGICAALIVVIGAVAAFLFCSSPSLEKREKVEKKPSSIKTVTPAPAAKPKPAKKKVEKAPVVTNGAPAWVNAKGLDPSLFPYTDGRKVLSTRTNTWDQVIDICMMPSGRRRKVLRNAKPPVYDNISDQILAMALSGDNDSELPPMPIPSEHELETAFVESMKKPIVINDDDSDAIKESKRRVMEARTVIDEQLKQGKGYREILEQHLADREHASKLRAEAMKGAVDLKKSGDTEALNAYLEGVNELLNSHGVGGIEAPHDKKNKEPIE